ncbi:MAG: T9SS type A sorting domain-containing protein, partial [Chitinophagales bacterium]
YCFMSMALPETVPDFDITCGNPELFNYFDAWLVAFELPNDIPVVQSTTKINIYPNPNSGNFNINSDMLKQGCLMQIFSIDGKQIYRNTIPATNNPYNFNQTILTKGCYIIQLNNAYETAYGTIIVD